MSSNLQKTIREPIEFKGVGLHNGIDANLCLKPAEANSGIKFRRTDVDFDKSIIEANYENVNSPILCTKIKNQHGFSVSTIEHLMAAFYIEGIDNVLVEIDAPEVPILDGSAFDFVEAIRSFGTLEQKVPKKFVKVLKKVEIKDGQKYISIEPLSKDLIITVFDEMTVSLKKLTTKTVSDENIADKDEYLNIKETINHVKINKKLNWIDKAAIIPKYVATPLPPLNFNQIVNTCPMNTDKDEI